MLAGLLEVHGAEVGPIYHGGGRGSRRVDAGSERELHLIVHGPPGNVMNGADAHAARSRVRARDDLRDRPDSFLCR